MEKKKLKKLSLKKETISSLTSVEQGHIRGGGTTSFNANCSNGFICCDSDGFTSLPKSCCKCYDRPKTDVDLTCDISTRYTECWY